MTPTVIGTLVFVCTFGGALVGLWLRAALPDQHLSDDSKDTVKVGIGLIATMTALVLGLVTASAKSSFDALNTAVKHTAADVLALDRTLARYGPESKAVRETLAQVIAQRLETTWPQHSSPVARLDHLEVTRGGEGLVEQIRGLAPQNEHQRWLQAHAVALSEALLDARLGGRQQCRHVRPWAVSGRAGLLAHHDLRELWVVRAAQRDRHCRTVRLRALRRWRDLFDPGDGQSL